METNRFNVNRDTLFEGRTETLAIVYEQEDYQRGRFVTDDCEIVYRDECNIYEQVEFFNTMEELTERKKVLENISKYKNFTIIETN